MKTVCLLRHAKSDWGEPGLADFDRPLNIRGRKAAEFMAGYIMQSAWKPDAVFCSTANRARATLAPLTAQLGKSTPVSYRDDLYHASASAILSAIQEAPDTASRLLVVGHNPGISLAAAALDTSGTTEDMPTAALVVLTFDTAHWANVRFGSGTLVFFGRPKNLMDNAT